MCTSFRNHAGKQEEINMIEDLSTRHELVSEPFAIPSTADEWAQYRLSDEQVAFYHEYGYLKGVQMLTDRQVEALRGELTGWMDPSHPGRHLFYEYHTNESK